MTFPRRPSRTLTSHAGDRRAPRIDGRACPRASARSVVQEWPPAGDRLAIFVFRLVLETREALVPVHEPAAPTIGREAVVQTGLLAGVDLLGVLARVTVFQAVML